MTTKRNIMKEFRLSEISAVDRPAQEHARMVIMKRADDESNKETAMTDDEKKALEAKDKAAKDAEDKAKETEKRLQAELAVAKSLASLNDAQKAFYGNLDAAGKTAFLAKSAEDRQAAVDAAKSADPVVFKSLDGTEYRKSDDARLVTMAKRADEDRTRVEKAERAAEDATFAKRAGTELDKLPGTEVTKVAVLRAIEGIADVEVRKAAGELLKAANSGLASAFETRGSTFGKSADSMTAEDEIQKGAEAIAKAKSIPFLKAYDEFLATDKGKELYEKTLTPVGHA